MVISDYIFLPLDGNDKIRNHLITNTILYKYNPCTEIIRHLVYMYLAEFTKQYLNSQLYSLY